MASTDAFAKARDAIRKAEREIRETERRIQTTFPSTDLRAGETQRVLQEAEAAVLELLALLNATPGRGVNFPLINEIRAAEIRVSKARAALKKIDPTGIE